MVDGITITQNFGKSLDKLGEKTAKNNPASNAFFAYGNRQSSNGKKKLEKKLASKCNRYDPKASPRSTPTLLPAPDQGTFNRRARVAPPSPGSLDVAWITISFVATAAPSREMEALTRIAPTFSKCVTTIWRNRKVGKSHYLFKFVHFL